MIGGDFVTFAQYLNTLMDRDGITAYKISKETGIPQQTLSSWRIGRTMPKSDGLAKLASFFHVPVESFIEKGDVSIEHVNKPAPVAEGELSQKCLELAEKINLLSDRSLQELESFVALLELRDGQ